MKRMKVLIVICNPNIDKSFSHKTSERVIEELKKLDHEVRYVDLYKIGFNPIGGPGDFTDRKILDRFDYHEEQLHASDTKSYSSDILEQMENITWCDSLVFLFPVWRWGLPAVLKGYFDRCFCPGFMFGKEANIRGKKLLFTVNTGGKNTTDEKHEMCWASLYHTFQNRMGAVVMNTFYFRNMNYEKYEKKLEKLEEYIVYLKNKLLK